MVKVPNRKELMENTKNFIKKYFHKQRRKIKKIFFYRVIN